MGMAETGTKGLLGGKQVGSLCQGLDLELSGAGALASLYSNLHSFFPDFSTQ